MRSRKGCSPTGGSTLVEVICAFAVVCIVTLGVMGSLVTTVRIDRESSASVKVENVAAAQMEEYLATSFHALSPGVVGPAAVEGCSVTVRVYEIDAGTMTAPPRLGIEVDVRDAQDPKIRATLVCARTDHSF